VAIAARLPRGAGVVFRGFGRPDQATVGARLAKVARARGLVLLVGADPGLARRLGADGVHLPERSLHLAPRIRRAHPRWIVTGAAHGAAALIRARRYGLDAALLSPVFPSRSPSAARALGALRFARLARDAGLPVYGLGGVTAGTAPRLILAGAAGLAAVDGVDEVGRRAQEPQHAEAQAGDGHD
jgi:thiamine-phosphate pyrophosphorylase